MAAQSESYGFGNIFRPTNAEFRSVCAENPTGGKGVGGMAVPDPEKGPAREYGQGWKVKPCLVLKKGETALLADIKGPGMITHIWSATKAQGTRDYILRFYWDDETEPSIEVPYGDFFCNGFQTRANITSIPVNVNPQAAFNCYWPMPFRKSARITIENQRNEDMGAFYYQIDYILDEVAEDSQYLHVQFRRTNPLPPMTPFTIVDGIKGKGRFAGTYMTWGQNNNGWWGEGEVKMYIDGDTDFPTYCGTGTEDYFGGGWCFNNAKSDGYETYSGPFLGYPQIIHGDGYSIAKNRHGLYRWHIMDPVPFKSDFKATIQALGFKDGGRFLSLEDDLSAAAFWYQTEPHASFPTIPSKDQREIT